MPQSTAEPVDVTKRRELRIPRPGGEVWQTVSYLFVSLFVVLALYNLHQFHNVSTVSIGASLLWLFFVGFLVVSNVREEGGLGKYVVNRMGCYSRFHFVRAMPPSGKAERIIVGFRIFGRDFASEDVNVYAISSLGWWPGQATRMSNDVHHDWQVSLGFNPSSDAKRAPLSGETDVRISNLLLIGPCFSKSNAEAFFNELLFFLTGVGVELIRGQDSREFVAAKRAHQRVTDSDHERAPHPTP